MKLMSSFVALMIHCSEVISKLWCSSCFEIWASCIGQDMVNICAFITAACTYVKKRSISLKDNTNIVNGSDDAQGFSYMVLHIYYAHWNYCSMEHKRKEYF